MSKAGVSLTHPPHDPGSQGKFGGGFGLDGGLVRMEDSKSLGRDAKKGVWEEFVMFKIILKLREEVKRSIRPRTLKR